MTRYLVAAVVFGIAAVVAGYFTSTLGLTFSGWLFYRSSEAVTWFATGCVSGVGLRFAFSPERR